MQHINLSNYKGSITDWTELNYINDGLADNLADITNIKVNDSCYNYLAKSANLIKLKDVAETTVNGITYSVKNGVITLNGTTTVQYWAINLSIPTLYAGTYYGTKFDINTPSNSTIYLGSTQTFNGNITTTTTYTNIRIYIHNINTAVNNWVIKPMLVRGSTAPIAYEPYGALVIHQNANKIIVTNTTSYTWMSPSFKNATIRLDAPYKAPNVPYKVRWQGNDNILTIGAEINGNMYISFKNAYANETELRNDMVGVIVWYELATPIVIPVINHTFTGSEAFALSSRAIVTDGTNSYIRVYLPNSFAIDKTKLDFGMAELPTQPYRYWTDAIATEYVSIDETNGNMLFCINTKKAGTTLATAVQWLTGKVLQYTSTE